MLVACHVVARERSVVDSGAATLDGAEEVDFGTASRLRERRSDPARALGIEMAIIGLGSFGAREMGYSSDVDVQFLVLDRRDGAAAGGSGIGRTPPTPASRRTPACGRPPQ